MSTFLSALPRSSHPDDVFEDPLGFLSAARLEHGDQVVLRDGESLLSHSRDCPGVIALFGIDWHRRVLGAPHDFTAAPSLSPTFGLPEEVARLNRSLHVMSGTDHVAHRRSLASALGPALLEPHGPAINSSIARFCSAWRAAGVIQLFDAMQQLVSEIGLLLLFGAEHRPGSPLHAALLRFFTLRRRLWQGEKRDVVIAAGKLLDGLLAEGVAAANPSSIAHQLARDLPGASVRGHLNVLFISLIEPVAVAATWALLVLTQRPLIRRSLRAASEQGPPGAPQSEMARVVLETLRLLSPNALMVRVATHDFECGGIHIPRGCEIVLTPFLAHRDPELFAEPTTFRPSRWIVDRPAPTFGFLPFGAGPHACVASRLAEALISQMLTGLLARVDPVLPHPQEVDWRVDITFRLRGDVKVKADNPEALADQKVVEWLGPVADLIEFEPERS